MAPAAERRLLQGAVALACLVPVGIGALGLLDGPGGGALRAHGLLGLGDEALAPIALGQHALAAAGRHAAELAGPPRPGAAVGCHRDPLEPVEAVERVDEPRVRQQPSGDRHRVVRPANEVEQPPCAGRRGAGAIRAGERGRR